ncbi:uncharacterized protein ACA1_368130 [Acanthamoeba castellanii str. Neff]|uniref:Uncharacterized protein n=1 Tax=Acanthamoeba castellanii (strain ATCC 30010 / Neff) TaxID=1257118 RepID=L8GYV7_ACACF|nr:uncharacterized protein ACA1_368130 [Acanthamoeba castellanii str. Neff]ELR18112.1 hypothetical protein ACA1_368130 [Acanthamoeba castellanii str. Neff]
MIKRGRPKGATAYPEHAVCIKCQVFRPKRRGYCDRCRPRNRGAAAKTAANPTINPATTITTSSPPPASSAGLTKLVSSEHQKQPRQDHDPMVIQNSYPPAVAGQSAGDNGPAASTSSAEAGSRGVKRQRHNAAPGGQQTAAQIRGKRRRTVSAPVSANNNNISGSANTNGRLATSLMMVSSAMQALERNRNVDVVSAYAAAGATAKDRKPGSSSSYYSTPGSAAHQLALLLPRSDGTAVDVVPLQFLSTASPTATAASSPSPALSSSGAASPTSSPSVTSSTHSLMSLANVSALAAARYPSPSSHSSSWSSSPPSSPPRQLLHSSSSPYSSPPSSSSSSLSFALPQPRASASHSSRAGDLVLPSLGSLALPRPALPLHFFPAHASAGLHLASMVAPAAPLRLAPN